MDSLDGVSESDLKNLNIPLRLCKSILTTYSKIKYPSTVDQPTSHNPDHIQMMVPNDGNLQQHGSVICNKDGIPNPFGGNVNGVDPKVKDIQDLVDYWDNSTDN